MFRRGLRGVLAEASDVEVVGEAEDGSAAVLLAVDQKADVVLMDLNMEGVGGVEATAALAGQRPATAVLVLTMSEDDSTVHAALRAGARGYLVKEASGDAILAAVRAVAAGSSVLLVVSDKTVRNHVSNLFAKLGVPDRSHTIVLARENGLGAT